MKRRGLQPMHDQHVNVTPMVDVVMCLIIFFLICGQLVALGAQKRIDIPVAKNGRQIPDLRGRVVINVLPSTLNTPPDISVVTGKSIPYPYEDLAEALRQAVAGNRDVKVIIRADKGLPYEFVAPLVRICSNEKVESVNLQIQE